MVSSRNKPRSRTRFVLTRKDRKNCKESREFRSKIQGESPKKAANRSSALDKGVDHLLLPCLVEIDGELVAVDVRHPAITEFLVEHPHADLKPCAFRGARCDQRAVDGDRLAARRLRRTAARPVALRALPPRRLVETARE